METHNPDDFANFGEQPGLGEGFFRSALKRALRSHNKQKLITKMKPEYEVMARVYEPSTSGERKVLYDGPADNLESQQAEDGVLIRLKDKAVEDFADHPLRDGVVLGAFGLLLMGGSFYVRHKTKK